MRVTICTVHAVNSRDICIVYTCVSRHHHFHCIQSQYKSAVESGIQVATFFGDSWYPALMAETTSMVDSIDILC